MKTESSSSSSSPIPDTGGRTLFSTGAHRDAMEGKGMPCLIPLFPMHLLSKRLEDGAHKYGRDNWRKGIPLSRYIDGFERHLRKWRLGWEDEDHEGAMLFNIVGLIETANMIRKGEVSSELDDLPERPIASTLARTPSNWDLYDLYHTSERDPYVPTTADKERLRKHEGRTHVTPHTFKEDITHE